MAKPLSFRWDEDFIARIDETRGDVSRSQWVRRAVELRIALRNLTNDEIDRLLDDWRDAGTGRDDDTDRSIRSKLAAGRTR